MAQETTEQRVQELERRLTAVEQILPTLATKTDLKEMRTELEAAIEAAVIPLATKAEVRAEAVETRRHFDIVAERMHDDIRMLAEHIVTTQERCDARHRDVTGTLSQHDRRLTRLEAPRAKRR